MPTDNDEEREGIFNQVCFYRNHIPLTCVGYHSFSVCRFKREGKATEYGALNGSMGRGRKEKYSTAELVCPYLVLIVSFPFLECQFEEKDVPRYSR